MNLSEKIIAEIESLVENSSLNRNYKDGFSDFTPPLVGFASVNNPLFSDYKNIIGDFHYLPKELFNHRLCRVNTVCRIRSRIWAGREKLQKIKLWKPQLS